MILVVDDDPAIRKAVLHLLAREGFECREAAGGQEALAIARTEAPALVLADVMMPEMDGVELVACLRTLPVTAGVKAIMVSALGEEKDMLRAFDAGADDYIVKPFSPRVLVAKVKSWLRLREDAAPPLDHLPAGFLFDERYEVQKVLGRGGSAVVYRAGDLLTGAEVALKVRTDQEAGGEEALRRFRREISALTLVNHPHVVRMFGSGAVRGHGYFTMEVLEGVPLKRRVGEQGRLPWREALRIAAEVAEGLEAVHQAGFIHRDVKPSNIFLAAGGQAKLGDFGIVLPVSRDTGRVTQVGMVIGTPQYMSPEQVLGRMLDARTDVYSLGITLFEMLTGKLPHEEAPEAQALALTLAGELPRPVQRCPDLPAEADLLFLRACASEPEGRFPTARDFADALWRAAGLR